MWHSVYSTAYDKFCILQYFFEFQLKRLSTVNYTNEDFVV